MGADNRVRVVQEHFAKNRLGGEYAAYHVVKVIYDDGTLGGEVKSGS